MIQIYKKLQLISWILKNKPQLVKLLFRNVLRNLTNYIDYNLLNGKSFHPKTLTFRVTQLCNYKCKMCIYFNKKLVGGSQYEISFHNFKKIIDETKHFRPFIIFTGGEPLLNKDIFKMISYCKQKGLFCSLTTNGWFIKDRLNEISNSGLDFMSVSLEGPEKLHDAIVGVNGAFKRAATGIKQLSEFKNRPLLFINYCVQSSNHDKLDKMVEIAEKLSVDAINFQFEWSFSKKAVNIFNQQNKPFHIKGGYDDPNYSNIDFRKLNRQIKNIKKRNMVINIFPNINFKQIKKWYIFPLKSIKNNRAKCAWLNGTIFHDSTVRMCYELIFGDINESSFMSIWNNRKFKQFRRKLKRNKFFSICPRCCEYYREWVL